jgi:hypothetical protein
MLNLISPQSPHAGRDAARYARHCAAWNAVSARGRGRPRTQDAHGSIILHIAIILNLYQPYGTRANTG